MELFSEIRKIVTAPMETGGRAGLRSNMEPWTNLHEIGLRSDCSVTVVGPSEGETREFLLHRQTLALSSPVFEAMLLPSEECKMLEAKEGKVTIIDIEPRIFHLALEFIYSKQQDLSLGMEDVFAVSSVADKYLVRSLTAACEKRLCALLTTDSVWHLLRFCESLLADYELLRKKCLEVLKRSTCFCLHSAELLSATEDSLVLLLQQDSLAVDGEFFLIASAVRWARHQASLSGSSLRSVLEPRVLPLLRLLSLSREHVEAVIMMIDSGGKWISNSEGAALINRDLTSLPDSFSRCMTKRSYCLF